LRPERLIAPPPHRLTMSKAIPNQCMALLKEASEMSDETRMCNLLGNQLAQLPWNEEIIRGSNQQRRIPDTPQAFSGIISEQRVDACRRDLSPIASRTSTSDLPTRSLAAAKPPRSAQFRGSRR
jgi:hypothetical protein